MPVGESLPAGRQATPSAITLFHGGMPESQSYDGKRVERYNITLGGMAEWLKAPIP